MKGKAHEGTHIYMNIYIICAIMTWLWDFVSEGLILTVHFRGTWGPVLRLRVISVDGHFVWQEVNMDGRKKWKERKKNGILYLMLK